MKNASNPAKRTVLVKGLTILCKPHNHLAILVVKDGKTKENAVGFYHWQYDGNNGHWVLRASGKIKSSENIDNLVLQLNNILSI